MDREQRVSGEPLDSSWRDDVQKGQSLLEQNAVADAVEALEQARAKAPDKAVVKTLLALAYLKSGQWASSAELYGLLAEDDESDAMVRLNAAICHIQLEEFEQACGFLEETVSLQPEMNKARSLLATVYRNLGRLEQAKEQFEATGNKELAQQMALAIRKREEEEQAAREAAEREAAEREAAERAAIEAAAVAAKAAEAAAAEANPLSLLMDKENDEADDFQADISAEFSAALSRLSGDDDEDSSIPSLEFDGLDMESSPKPIPVTAGFEQTDGAFSVIVVPSEEGATPVLRRFPSSSVEEDVLPFSLTPPQAQDGSDGGSAMNIAGAVPLWVDLPSLFESPQQVFALLEDGRLFMQIEEAGYARLNDLMLLMGEPNVQWETKRFQGKPIEQLFGPRDNPIARIQGACHLLLGTNEDKKRTSVLLSGSDIAYFREGAVLAFGNGIQWENGRVPSALTGISDLPLDNFWGEGELILESQGPIWGVPVKHNNRVRIEYQRLIGWVGSLVPQIIADEALSPSLKMRAFVEFEGEGGILISS